MIDRLLEPRAYGRPPAPARGTIFVSYRRQDSQGPTGRLTEDLRRHYTKERVYRDVDSNVVAVDYLQQIQDALHDTVAMVVVIGPQWLASETPDGLSRLHSPADLVRREIEHALRAGIVVVPVLIDGARMPSEHQLPDSLKPLVMFEAQPLSDGAYWPYGMRRILDTLERNGVYPSAAGTDPYARPEPAADVKARLTRPARFERSVRATREAAYRAVVAAATALHYRRSDEDAQGGYVQFTAIRRTVTVSVIDDRSPGQTRVEVKFTTARWWVCLAAVVTLAVVLPGIGIFLGIGGWIYQRVVEKRFAAGFLDNVQGMLDRRGIVTDPAPRWRFGQGEGSTRV